MAAAPLPAARQITRPLGIGGRCGASTTSGCAAATAASKIARRRGRRSVMVSRIIEQTSGCLSLLLAQKKTPHEHDPEKQKAGARCYRAPDLRGEHLAKASRRRRRK